MQQHFRRAQTLLALLPTLLFIHATDSHEKRCFPAKAIHFHLALDCSETMTPYRDLLIETLNLLVNRHHNSPRAPLLTLYSFNSETEEMYKRTPINLLIPWKTRHFPKTQGPSALYSTIYRVSKYALTRQNDEHDNLILVVTNSKNTDQPDPDQTINIIAELRAKPDRRIHLTQISANEEVKSIEQDLELSSREYFHIDPAISQNAAELIHSRWEELLGTHP